MRGEMSQMRYYANVYEHCGRLGVFQFIGNWHASRKQCETAERMETEIERETRLIGRVVVNTPYVGDTIPGPRRNW